jgi:hypothetical protein
MAGLERVFPKGHRYYDRLFYDTKEGMYYDLNTDLYLSTEEAKAFGIP